MQEPSGGRIAVSIDGGRGVVVSLKARQMVSRVAFSRAWTSAGLHTLDASVIPGPGTRVALDAFVVVQQLAAAPAPFVRRV
jgi:hypothetical protein